MKYLRLFEKFDESKIDKICQKYYIRNYTINPNESIDVDGYVDLYNIKLTKLPLKFNKVGGWFDCHNNKLTSLEGSDCDIFRDEDTDTPSIFIDRLNDYLGIIGKDPVEKVDKYKNI